MSRVQILSEQALTYSHSLASARSRESRRIPSDSLRSSSLPRRSPTGPLRSLAGLPSGPFSRTPAPSERHRHSRILLVLRPTWPSVHNRYSTGKVTHNRGPVAQWTECLVPDQDVAGSNPVGSVRTHFVRPHFPDVVSLAPCGRSRDSRRVLFWVFSTRGSVVFGRVVSAQPVFREHEFESRAGSRWRWPCVQSPSASSSEGPPVTSAAPRTRGGRLW